MKRKDLDRLLQITDDIHDMSVDLRLELITNKEVSTELEKISKEIYIICLDYKVRKEVYQDLRKMNRNS